jgi:hypothetical protein
MATLEGILIATLAAEAEGLSLDIVDRSSRRDIPERSDCQGAHSGALLKMTRTIKAHSS